MEKPIVEGGYLNRIFEVKEYVQTLDKAIAAIKLFEAQFPFDAIAFSGTSGAAIGFPLSYMLRKHVICVRKQENPASHSWSRVQGLRNGQNYIIVDDCIDTGDTIRRIRSEVEQFSPGAKVIGIYLFSPLSYRKCWTPDDIKLIPNPFEEEVAP